MAVTAGERLIACVVSAAILLLAAVVGVSVYQETQAKAPQATPGSAPSSEVGFETPRQRHDREMREAVRSETRYDGGALLTIVHDGHWFVVEEQLQKGTHLHHPDCLCRKTVEWPD